MGYSKRVSPGSTTLTPCPALPIRPSLAPPTLGLAVGSDGFLVLLTLPLTQQPLI